MFSNFSILKLPRLTHAAPMAGPVSTLLSDTLQGSNEAPKENSRQSLPHILVRIMILLSKMLFTH